MVPCRRTCSAGSLKAIPGVRHSHSVTHGKYGTELPMEPATADQAISALAGPRMGDQSRRIPIMSVDGPLKRVLR
jgi:hypothetical protein